MNVASTVAAAIIALSVSQSAEAKPTVVVDAPTIEGVVPPAWPQQLHTRAVEGFRVAGLDATTTESGAPVDSDDSRISARLTITAQDRDFELRLDLLDAQSEEPIATLAETCDTCGFSELAERVDAVTASAVRALEQTEPQSASVTVRSDPAGATVLVDGTALGSTPLQTLLEAGEHRLTIRVAGHRPHQRRVAVAEGEIVAYDIALAPVVEPPTRRARVLRGIGAGGVAVGLASVAAGATLLWLHGRPIQRDCTGANVDADGQCRFLHDTRAGGVTMAVLGGGVAIAGATLLGLQAKKRRSTKQVAVHPTVGGVRVRF